MAENSICMSCGEKLIGKFCHKCGNKIHDRNEYTAAKFFEQTLDVFTHFESKLLKSIYLLFTKPGQLTYEYLRGNRVRYSKPVQIFFIANIVYFFVLNYIGYDVFTSTLGDIKDNAVYGNYVSNLVQKKMTGSDASVKIYEEKFYDKIYVQSKLLIIVMIPMIALFLKFLYRSSDRLYYEHLIYSTHLLTFLLLFFTIILNALSYALYFILNIIFKIDTEYIFSNEFGILITCLCLIFYVYLSLKKVYAQTFKITIIKSALFLLSLFIVTEIYRLLLFFAVYYF